MNIIIVGAGKVGTHIASVLSKEGYNVIVIDKDRLKLQHVSAAHDLATIHGDGSNWQLLDDLKDFSPDMILALTDHDEVNLVICSLAKNLGYPRVVAKVRKRFYLPPTPIDLNRTFYIDHLLNPDLLAAEDLFKAIMNPILEGYETFADGTVQMKTLFLPPIWRKSEIPLKDLKLPNGVVVGLIRRIEESQKKPSGENYKKIIFPHGQDYLAPHDEVTFIGERDAITNIEKFCGLHSKKIASVVIVGSSIPAILLAKLLIKQNVYVRIIEKDLPKCRELTEEIPEANVILHDGSDFDFLRGERLVQADVLVACTGSDEKNHLIALLAKELNCPRVMSLIADTQQGLIIEKLGLAHSVSPLKVTSDRILPIVRGDVIHSMTSLYDDEVEILEIAVSKQCQFIGKQLAEVGPKFPPDFLLAAIRNKGRVLIANGKRVVTPGDTLIAITHKRHLPYLKKIF